MYCWIGVLIHPYYLYTAPDPIRRKIDPATIPAELYDLFHHLLAIHLELDLFMLDFSAQVSIIY